MGVGSVTEEEMYSQTRSVSLETHPGRPTCPRRDLQLEGHSLRPRMEETQGLGVGCTDRGPPPTP